jgi:hypothetical protein
LEWLCIIGIIRPLAEQVLLSEMVFVEALFLLRLRMLVAQLLMKVM